MNCVTPVILKQNLKSKSKNLEIEIVKLTDGPNGFTSGGKQFHPKSNDMRLIHMTVALKNLKTTDYDIILENVALEPTYATILNDKYSRL